MKIDVKSLTNRGSQTSRLSLRLIAVAAMAGLVLAAIPLLDRLPSDSVEIKTRDADRVSDEVALEEIGGEQLEAEPLQVDGLDPLETENPDIEASAADEVTLPSTSTTTPDESSTPSSSQSSSSTATTRAPLEVSVSSVVADVGISTTTTRSNPATSSPQLTTLRTTTTQRSTISQPSTTRRTTTSARQSTTRRTTPTTRPTTTRGTPTTSRGTPTTSRATTSTRPRQTTSSVTVTTRPGSTASTRPAPTQPTSTQPTQPTSTQPAPTQPAPTQPTTQPTQTTTPGTTPGPLGPAVIPHAPNGVGDGPNGGQNPYAPPAARIDFQDVADQAATTVQAACTGNADCGVVIRNLLRDNRARPIKITFGDPNRRGATVNLRSRVRLESGVTLEGINQPRVVASDGGNLFTVAGTNNVSIRNFDLDLQGCRHNPTSVVAAPSPATNLFVSGINVINASAGGNAYCDLDFVRITGNGQSRNVNIYGNSMSRVRRFVRVQADVDTIRVYNNVITELGFEGYTQTWQSISRNVTIEGNVFSRHAPRTVGGHMIQFPISKAASPQTYAYNVVIRHNLVEGRPNIAHIRDPVTRESEPTGGAGDLIAIRGIDGFLLESNVVRHSGEVGITATAGLKNGTIRYNQVSYTDTTGIVVGNEAFNSNERVTNVDVYRNEMFQNSLDRAREYTDRDHPTFSLWNTTNSCFVNNYIHHNMNSNGFWVWNGNTSVWPASVFDVYIHDQRFHNNKRDFVESARQTGPYSPAPPRGGANWTSTFDRAVDNDGDGLPSLCGSERNDNDPCSPDIYAEACNR